MEREKAKRDGDYVRIESQLKRFKSQAEQSEKECNELRSQNRQMKKEVKKRIKPIKTHFLSYVIKRTRWMNLKKLITIYKADLANRESVGELNSQRFTKAEFQIRVVSKH
jgi:hypothetical protein